MSRSVLIWSAVSFLSAFLLFVVQPMATKAILPILGGSPSVWNTAMVCFQLLLLGGYIYAHLIGSIRSARLQLLTHATMLALSALQLPIAFDHLSTTDAVTSPLYWTIGTLILGIGLPFFCLASTAPLLQRWITRSNSPLATEPYRLYSVSNAGSMLALFGYLLVVEPYLDLQGQHRYWSYLYILFALLILSVGLGINRQAITPAAAPEGSAPTWRDRGIWLILAFIPSSLMLGVTTYLTTDIASLPMLWVLPLAIYLASFIAAFGRYHAWALKCCRHAYILVLCFILCWVGQLFISMLLPLHLLGLAIGCFAIHSLLAARRPHPAYLTQFYIFLSLGGALGGMFNALAAPLLFSGTTEYPLMLALASFALFLHRRRQANLLYHGWILSFILLGAVTLSLLIHEIVPAWSITTLFITSTFICCAAALLGNRSSETRILIVVMMITLPIVGYFVTQELEQNAPGERLYNERNFFGTVRVNHDRTLNANKLVYNTTLHGLQWRDPARMLEATGYYRDTLIEVLSTLASPYDPIAVVGLGTGTTQCLVSPSQHIDFYDINRAVIDIAKNTSFFTFLRDCPGTHSTILGDGRLMLAQAKARYSIVVIDAFSSDAIPIHLITREALETYATKLRKGGVILLHISNRYITLGPLLARQAASIGWVAYQKDFSTPYTVSESFDSSWVVLAPDTASLAPLLSSHEGWYAPPPIPKTRPWTDSYSNILPYIRFTK